MRDVLINLPALHHEPHIAHCGNVCKRISRNSDKICLISRSNSPDLVTHSERFSRYRRSADNRIHRFLSTLFHAIDELLSVASMRTGNSIGAKRDLHALGPSPPKHIDRRRNPILNDLELGIGERIARAVLQIVVQHRKFGSK